MNVKGWALDEIRRWSGYTITSITLKYIYSPFRESETRIKVKKSSIFHTNKDLDLIKGLYSFEID